MHKNHDLDDAINREMEKRLQNKPEHLSEGLEKAIQDTKDRINDAFRERPKVHVTPKRAST